MVYWTSIIRRQTTITVDGGWWWSVESPTFTITGQIGGWIHTHYTTGWTARQQSLQRLHAHWTQETHRLSITWIVSLDPVHRVVIKLQLVIKLLLRVGLTRSIGL